MATSLTSRFCASARPKTGKDGKPIQTAFPDDDPTGLELRVSAEGRKSWSYRYRTLEGRQRRITLGAFVAGDDEPGRAAVDEPQRAKGEAEPARSLTLREARRRARALRATVEAGDDPAAQRRAAKASARSAAVRTFDQLADAYLTACEVGEWRPKGRKKRDRTLSDERNILRRHVRPALGALAFAEIGRPAVKKLLRAMAARGIGAQTNRTHAVMRQVFAWAIAEELTESNPATGFAPVATEEPRVRVIRDAELKAIWQTCEAPEGRKIAADDGERPLYLSREMAIIVELSALTLQRRAEISGMRLDELNLAERTWLIPAERAKQAKPHLVPLTDRAVTLIREAMELAALNADRPSPCIFPGRRDPNKPVRPDSVTHALASAAAASGVAGITVHDFRRTGASALASERLGVAPFIVSKVLGHSDTGGAAGVTLRHYAIYDYAPEKRRALEAWENLLLEIVGEREPAANVVRLGVAS